MEVEDDDNYDCGNLKDSEYEEGEEEEEEDLCFDDDDDDDGEGEQTHKFHKLEGPTQGKRLDSGTSNENMHKTFVKHRTCHAAAMIAFKIVMMGTVAMRVDQVTKRV